MRRVPFALGLGILTFVSACSSSGPSSREGPPKSASSQLTSNRPEMVENWTLVTLDPPTFHPKGFPADSPTSGDYGEWVVARKNSARWFVPHHGFGEFSGQQLREEAFSWQQEVHKVQSKRKRRENPMGYAGELLAKTAITGLGAAILVGGLMGGGSPSPDSPAMTMLEDLWEAASH